MCPMALVLLDIGRRRSRVSAKSRASKVWPGTLSLGVEAPCC